MRIHWPVAWMAGLLVGTFAMGSQAQEVLLYTGNVSWLSKAAADQQARICVDRLEALGISATWFDGAEDDAELADRVADATGNGKLDVLVLYGYVPGALYPAGNGLADGSVAELFIESPDGDTIINHGDYMFYVSSPNNGATGLQNLMDIPAITLWDDNTPVVVTDEGREIAPSLSDFLTDRPFHLDELAGDWFVEASLAENEAGTRADPVIVRDGDRGRLVPVYQTANQSDPKGAVAAEIIAWLYGLDVGEAERVGFVGKAVGLQGWPIPLGVQIQNVAGGPSPVDAPTSVSLQTDSAMGAFDLLDGGAFDGSVTSVTVAAGESTASFYYRDSTAGSFVLTGSVPGLANGTVEVTVYDTTVKPPGEVAVYTGAVGWIAKAAADQQAQICMDRLTAAGVPSVGFFGDIDDDALAEWVALATDNEKLDVLILYGSFPPALYPAGNTLPDGSVAELFIESEDGDMIINHGDWMFYVNTVAINGAAGLQNMMDIPGIQMSSDDTPMIVTDVGREIAPSLADFVTDRPFFLDELAGEWFVEAALAQSADGALSDPCIVRDGNRGRLAAVYQTNNQADPKGAVAAEIVSWMLGAELVPTQLGMSGATATVAGTQVRYTIQLQDFSGTPMAAPGDVVVELESSSATGAFDALWEGSFNGTVTAVTIAEGESSASFYYKDHAARMVTLSATATDVPGLSRAELSVNVLVEVPVAAGEVAIYTGNVGWIDKAAADVQARICADALEEAGVAVTWYASDADTFDLAAWVSLATDNGKQDVLILYGYLPSTLYPEGNGLLDGSVAELFIESEDGDTIINHGDYMFYVSTTSNGVGGLQNLMDLPLITMWDDDTPVSVTSPGRLIAPSLVDFMTDRPLHVDELAGDWFVEAALAESATGPRADPVIVRDGNRGRLVPVHQAANQDDPKGAVAAEIVLWLREKATGEGGDPVFHRGDANGDGGMNITDGIFVLNYLFLGGDAPGCLEAANGNDDAEINITDGIYILNYLFLGGEEPPAPGPADRACGPDPRGSPTALGCGEYPPASCR